MVTHHLGEMQYLNLRSRFEEMIPDHSGSICTTHATAFEHVLHVFYRSDMCAHIQVSASHHILGLHNLRESVGDIATVVYRLFWITLQIMFNNRIERNRNRRIIHEGTAEIAERNLDISTPPALYWLTTGDVQAKRVTRDRKAN